MKETALNVNLPTAYPPMKLACLASFPAGNAIITIKHPAYPVTPLIP